MIYLKYFILYYVVEFFSHISYWTLHDGLEVDPIYRKKWLEYCIFFICLFKIQREISEKNIKEYQYFFTPVINNSEDIYLMILDYEIYKYSLIDKYIILDKNNYRNMVNILALIIFYNIRPINLYIFIYFIYIFYNNNIL